MYHAAAPDLAAFAAMTALEAEATAARTLEDLARSVADAPLDALVLALRETCRNGWGDWMLPTDAGTSARPATHLVEIHILGVQGTGLTVEEAANNWRRAALNLTTQERNAA